MTGKFANYFQLLDSFIGTTKGLQRWYPFCLRGKKDHTKALCISTGAEFLGTQDKLTTHSVEVHITLSQPHASVFKLGKQKHRNLVGQTKTVYMHTMRQTDIQVNPPTHAGSSFGSDQLQKTPVYVAALVRDMTCSNIPTSCLHAVITI